jgi:hypothetical protein
MIRSTLFCDVRGGVSGTRIAAWTAAMRPKEQRRRRRGAGPVHAQHETAQPQVLVRDVPRRKGGSPERSSAWEVPPSRAATAALHALKGWSSTRVVSNRARGLHSGIAVSLLRRRTDRTIRATGAIRAKVRIAADTKVDGIPRPRVEDPVAQPRTERPWHGSRWQFARRSCSFRP